MSDTNKKLIELLAKRYIAGNKRSLQQSNNELIDFCSNDYLGLASSVDLKHQIVDAYLNSNSKNGSTGSRLLTGNSALAESTEQLLAHFFDAEDCLVFNSGYTANLSFFSTIPQRGDTILYDELSHSCIKDGSRLSNAKAMAFKHNDLIDLEKKIIKAEGKIFVACEAVYSMDGDMAPIEAMVKLCEKHEANLVVDEAHSTGVIGPNGTGLIAELGLSKRVFARILTFGKAFGIHGACIASDRILKEYLINFARPFIYTTAPSDFDFIAIAQVIKTLKLEQHERVNQLNSNIATFNQQLLFKREGRYASTTAIQVILISGNEHTKEASNTLMKNGFDVRPILSPTVREGEERLRICLHSFNHKDDIARLTGCLNSLLYK